MLFSVIPQSDLLKPYIEVFYFFKDTSNTTFSYLAFPHVNTGISIFKGAKISRKDYTIKIESSQTADYHVEILGKYTQPVYVSYNGIIEEISIIFKPLGISRFLSTPYFDNAPEFSQALSDIEWIDFTKTFFENKNTLAELEAFLIRQLHHNPEFELIEKALPLMTNSDAKLTDICEQLSIPKTFQRLFSKHMGCSPITYKRILKFRKSINEHLYSNKLSTLTDISHNNFYYDQAYFIKEFKKMTGKSPKLFFKKSQLVDNNKIIWEIY